MRIIAVVGIRSQYIKLCSMQYMLKKLDTINKKVEMIYVDAGQHYDFELASGFINELGIVFDEKIEYESKDPIKIFSEMIYSLAEIFVKYDSQKKVDYIMLFGDANTTMAASVAASKVGIKSIHVEAGLRLGNLASQEEGNRIVADHLASILYVSNICDFANLRAEGLINRSFFSGDIIQDLVLDLSKSGILKNEGIKYFNEVYHDYNSNGFVLASMHRKENIKDNCIEVLFKVFDSIEEDVLFIAHPSVIDKLSDIQYNNKKIKIATYIPYRDTLKCISSCKYLITDSGAFQREAYYLRKRCLIRQDVAFWQHLVDIGVHYNIGKTYESMMLGVEKMKKMLLEDYPSTDYFGDGNSVKTIFSNLLGENNDVV